MNAELENLKREQFFKLKEIGKALNLDFNLETNMKELKKHKEMVDKANSLMRMNNDLEVQLSSLTQELSNVTKERETLQESYSQQLIIMNKKLEEMKEEKEQKLSSLEHKTKAQMEHNQRELNQIEKHNIHMMKQMKSVMNNIDNNEFLRQVKKDSHGDNMFNDFRETGIQEGEDKTKELEFKQIQERLKEKEAFENQYRDLIYQKDLEFEALKEKYEKVMKHRDQEIERAKVEIVKIFTSIFDQEMKIKAKQMLQYDMNTRQTQEWNEAPFNSMMNNMADKFPMLLRTLKEKKGVLLNERGKPLAKIKPQNVEKPIEELTDEELIEEIKLMQSTKADMKYKYQANKIKEKIKLKDSKGNFQMSIPYKNPSLFQTMGSGRPMTQTFGHRSSMGNLHSKLMMSEVTNTKGFFHNRRRDNRATSIQSTRSKSNTKRFV
ncbi:unnamed protein product [Moneuplotes crassus]|uniref:Cilia- and flagella-associated protein 157 n=1 Tax=Euplotes crassus TaxID=5936 RepID=A0AAD1XBB6_EUPCR|nr:unnamed protein product [Moneuplotes crassus]